jgi:hypothetical protein
MTIQRDTHQSFMGRPQRLDSAWAGTEQARLAAPAGDSLALRWRVRLTRSKLDDAILAGEPADVNPALALRARQLTDTRTRRRAARQLRGIVQYVERIGPRPLITAVVIEPSAVRPARQAILGLAQRLDSDQPVQPGGVILAQRLLTDGLGPLFNLNSERTVVGAIWETIDALEGHTTTGFDAVAS